MANRISFLAGWDEPHRRARGKLSQRMTRIQGATIDYQRVPARREATRKLVLGTAGICDGELDWSMDLADDAGNDRVRIRTIKALQNLSQARSIFQI